MPDKTESEYSEYRRLKRDAVRKLKESMDMLLACGGEEAYTQLCQIMENKELSEMMMLDNALYHTREFTKIYLLEKKLKSRRNVLSLLHGLSDVKLLYRNIVFALYRMEEDVNVEYQNEAVQYLVESGIGAEVIFFIAESKIIDYKTFEKNLVQCLDRNGYGDFKRECIGFLKTGNLQEQENE